MGLFQNTTQTITKSAGGGIFNTLWNTIKFVTRRWWVFLAIFFMISTVFIGVADSIKQKSVNPLILQVGGRIVGADTMISEQIKYIKLNPEVAYAEANEFTSAWDKIKFRFGKWKNYYLLALNLGFLIGMLVIYYMGLKFIDDRTLVNVPFAIFILISFQVLFNIMLLVQQKTGNIPSMGNFLNSYTSLLNIAVLVVSLFIAISILIASDASKNISNYIYFSVFMVFMFMLIGMYGVLRTTPDYNFNTDKQELYPLKGIFFGDNSLIKNWRVILGKGWDQFDEKFPTQELPDVVNNNSLINISNNSITKVVM